MFIPLHDANRLRHIRLQYVTLGLILANCVIWLLFGTTALGDASSVRATIASYGFIPAVATGHETLPANLYRVPAAATYVTYAFLHSDFMHLAGNMLFIWVFGDNVEDAMGHLKYLVFFLACAAAGAATHAFVQPLSVSPLIGASGAAAGVITAYMILHPRVKIWILALGRIPLRLSALWVAGAWIAFQVYNFVSSDGDSVSWAAHVGGIVAGIVLLPLLKRRDAKMFDFTPVDETVPPVPPPSVPSDSLPGGAPAPQEADERGPWDRRGSQPDDAASGESPKSASRPWGRQPGNPR